VRILLVEDEPKIASFISRGLKEANYVVDIVSEGNQALFQAEVNPYDLIILDIMIPGRDGFSVCRLLRSKGIDVPILMLTARDSLKDRISGLDSGADDYLTKPFAFQELLARVRALLRRKRTDKTTTIKLGELELDQLSRSVKRLDKEIKLTSKEYSLLEYLILHSNQVVTRTMISEHVWNEDFDSFTNVIDVYINFLRNKIDKGFPKPMLHTLRGIGYILKE